MDTQFIQDNKPDTKVSITWYEYILDLISLLIVIGSWVYFFLYFFDLPDKIPSHFNSLGEIDGYSSKNILFLMPSLITFIFLLFTVLTFIPKKYNYAVPITIENSKLQYKLARVFIRTLRLFVEVLLSYILVTMVISANESRSILSMEVIFSFVGVEMMTIFIYIYLSCKHKNSSNY
jgi:uncharacterized membrane protein